MFYAYYTPPGWSRIALLAHRFYLILPLALLLTLCIEIDPAIWTLPILGTISAVAVLGFVLPLYLLQVSIEQALNTKRHRRRRPVLFGIHVKCCHLRATDRLESIAKGGAVETL